MIVEGIVTTLDAEGRPNVAPMGPRLDPGQGFRRLWLRPFRTSRTFANLQRSGEAVFHVVDDPLLLARALLQRADDSPGRPASAVRGLVLTGACRYYELRVLEFEDDPDRPTFATETVAEGRFRDFLGFNRARNAVLEAAILASRAAFLPIPPLFEDLKKLALLVDKTGDEAEHEAFALLETHIRGIARQRGFDLDRIDS